MFDDAYDIPDFDFDFDLDIVMPAVEDDRRDTDILAKARTHKTIDRHMYRRYSSERALENTLDWQFNDGECHHVISMGDIDSLTFLKFILRQQKLDYCLLSTWCMALRDIEELERWLSKKLIRRLDCYVGEIFKGSYAREYDALCRMMATYGGRVCIFRNHAKVYAGFGPRYAFTVESSANINTNPRCENTVITINRDLAIFYKDFWVCDF